MNYLSLSFTFIAILLSPSLFASDSLYFAQIYSTINDNIGEDKLEENLLYIDHLVMEKAFQDLDCYQRGKIFHKIGISYYLIDREEEALRYFKDSVLTIWENCDEVPGTEKATTVFNVGLCYQYLGKIEQAKKYLDDALSVFENDSSYTPYNLAKKYQVMGNFYLDNHNSFRAELYYQNALTIFRDIEDTENRRFSILNNLLILSLDFKKYDKAKEYFEQALALHHEFPQAISDWKRSMIYQNTGIAHWELGELEEASFKNDIALSLIDPETDPAFYSNAIELKAVIESRRGNYEKALQALNEVVEIRSNRLSNAESYKHLSSAYESISNIFVEQNDFPKAKTYLEKAFETLMIHGSYDQDKNPVVSQSVVVDNLQLISLFALKSKIHQKAFENNKEKTALEKSLALYFKIDTVITNNLLALQFQGSKLNFLELMLEHYGSAIDQAILLYSLTRNQQYLHTAYYFSSKTKAIILQNELNNSDAFQSVASPELIEQENDLVRKMYSVREQMTKNETDNDTLLRQYIRLQRELETFIKNTETKEPDFYQKKYAFINPPKINSIQEALPKDLMVIEYFYKADTIQSFWITADNFFHLSIANDSIFENAVQTYVDQCHNHRIALSANLGEHLYQKLIQKGIDQVDQNISRLCVIPDGILHTVPFEVLNTSEDGNIKYLIEDYSISFSYSVGLLFRKGKPLKNKKYLGIGTTYSPGLNKKLKEKGLLFGENKLAQLSLALEEINRASEIFSGDRYLNREATLENFYRHSGQANIIHLSLHGLVDKDDPLRSSILFDDNQEDFVLFASDLYSHKITASLVILSACHTASGKIFNGEGVQGMSKAFMLSGAKNVLSSLWSASEASSLKIMTSFLQNIDGGDSNDLALHKAKLKYLETADPSQLHPFYWANYILLGELDQSLKRSAWNGKMIGLAVAFVALALYLFFQNHHKL